VTQSVILSGMFMSTVVGRNLFPILSIYIGICLNVAGI